MQALLIVPTFVQYRGWAVCAEMLAVEELWAGAACDSGRPVIVFNGGCRRVKILTTCAVLHRKRRAVQWSKPHSMAPHHVRMMLSSRCLPLPPPRGVHMQSGARKGRPCGAAGEVDRIRSGYYPALFYPKIGRLATNLLPQMTTVYYIHNFKGSGGGAHLRHLRVVTTSSTAAQPAFWNVSLECGAWSTHIPCCQAHPLRIVCKAECLPGCQGQADLLWPQRVSDKQTGPARRHAVPRLPGAVAGAARHAAGSKQLQSDPHAG